VINAGRRSDDLAWFEKHLPRNGSVLLEDRSDVFAAFALQGPKAEELLKQILPGLELPKRNGITSIPDYAKYYGIAKIDSDKFGLQKYGFHGISVGSILHKLQSENAQLPSRLIVCHIGSGVSVTAIKDGKSIENSMGFTPLEGVMMATRAGDVDPGVLAFLEDNLALKGKKLREYLNKKSGLLGVSGKSSDVRDLIKLEQDGDTQSKLALDMYAYRLQKYIGSYFTILGGLDTIVFTATVGERSFIMRERICQGLEILGIKIDQEKNNRSEGIDADISASGSKVKVLVRKTDEMGQMARDTISILEK
jgi:acetate kinase